MSRCSQQFNNYSRLTGHVTVLSLASVSHCQQTKPYQVSAAEFILLCPLHRSLRAETIVRTMVRPHLFLVLLALAAFGETMQEAGDSQMDGEDLSCDKAEADSEGQCSRREEPTQKYGTLGDLHPNPNTYLHAESVKLRKGRWCVKVEHEETVIPLVLAMLAVQYGSKVTYAVLMSRPQGACPGHPGPIVNILSTNPFSIYYVFLPGMEFGKEKVTMTKTRLCDSNEYIDLDGFHADRLLTCSKEIGQPRCQWYREEEGDGEDVGLWYTPPQGEPLEGSDQFLTPEEAEPFTKAFPLSAEETGSERYFLTSDWLTMRDRPGCLRLWLFAWGNVPTAVKVYVQDIGSLVEEALILSLDTPYGQVVVWREVHIPVVFSDVKLTVEFRGGWGWIGSMFVDDISDGETCNSVMPTL